MPSPSQSVFVIHGRDASLNDSMFSLLREFGLSPLEWSVLLRETGDTNPYIGEVLDVAFRIATAAVVMFTPDDMASLRADLRLPDDQEYELGGWMQARPNVLFEAGMAMGRSPHRTVLVEVGRLRPFSDIAGRHVLRLNNSADRRRELALRLEAAGCTISLGSAWETIGNFSYAEVDNQQVAAEVNLEAYLVSDGTERASLVLENTGEVTLRIIDVGLLNPESPLILLRRHFHRVLVPGERLTLPTVVMSLDIVTTQLGVSALDSAGREQNRTVDLKVLP